MKIVLIDLTGRVISTHKNAIVAQHAAEKFGDCKLVTWAHEILYTDGKPSPARIRY
jgi:hypothetical protein